MQVLTALTASTGGIIALGLAAKGWSVSQCIENFEDLCETAFTRRQGGNLPGIGWLVESHHHSRYETQPLQNALKEAFEDDYLFGGPRIEGSEVEVAVVATSSTGSTVVLSNYNRTCEDKRTLICVA